MRVGFIGLGGQGRVLLGNAIRRTPRCARSATSTRPAQGRRRGAASASVAAARHYADWQDMLQKEDLEAVIMAPPLWAHADIAVGCLEAGKHVLCEKMMAWDVAGCERMREAARKNGTRARDRLSALLQPGLPGGLRGHRQGGAARRRLPRAAGVAPQRQLAAQGRAARRPTTTRRAGATRPSSTC